MARVTYSIAIADAIAEQIVEGLSMRAICAKEGMPDRVTVYRWMEAHSDFAAKCARASELRAEYLADRIEQVADASTNDTAQADKVKISAYQWVASKLNRAKYGERLNVEHSGSVKVIEDMSFEELQAELERLALKGVVQPVLEGSFKALEPPAAEPDDLSDLV